VFEIVQKTSNFLLEIKTLVSSANIMGFDMLFIVGGRSFMYIINSKGPRIDPWGTGFPFPEANCGRDLTLTAHPVERGGRE
jgi:hypothetical protein